MFVKWSTRSRKSLGMREEETPKLFTAMLVESRRVEGKPRHQAVAYLGSIRSLHLKHPLFRRDFLIEAEKTIEGLDLGPDVRDKIMATLEAKVTRPSADEIERAEAERVALMAMAAAVRRQADECRAFLYG